MKAAPSCPDCGAVWSQIEICQAAFDEFLALEFSDAGYGAVHFLTVTCFMVQHRRYSDSALAHMREALRAYFEEGLSADELRRQSAAGLQQGTREWKVRRQPDEPPLAPIAWSMTIADVAASQQDAASYRRLVTEWAQTVLAEMGVWRNPQAD